MRRAALLAVPLAAAAGAGAVLLAGGDGDGAAAETSARPAATAKVARRTLVDRQRVDGTLGYSDTRAVLNRLQGTITWLPSEGSVVRRGGVLLRVDGEPVLLMYGATPAYRPLKRGDEGDDVRQLESNLAALGHSPGVVDDEYTASTAAAVRAWQVALGLDETGSVALGRVVFLPGARRVADVKAQLGAGGAGPAEVMSTTATRRVVTIDLAAADQSIAREGARVGVELPDGEVIGGRIARVGRVAGQSQGGADDDGGPTIAVTVHLRGRNRGGRLDQAPVSVEIARETARRVLAVPVTALVARRGGRYALDVAEGGRRRLVDVSVGLFADGYVEVEGRGLRAGLRVAVPAE